MLCPITELQSARCNEGFKKTQVHQIFDHCHKSLDFSLKAKGTFLSTKLLKEAVLDMRALASGNFKVVGGMYYRFL